MRILHLHLKKKHWDKIKSGEKPEEYRERSYYWYKRLHHKIYDLVYLYCGYPKRNDFSRILVRKWKGRKEKKIYNEQFNGKAHVYAIDVTQVARVTEC